MAHLRKIYNGHLLRGYLGHLAIDCLCCISSSSSSSSESSESEGNFSSSSSSVDSSSSSSSTLSSSSSSSSSSLSSSSSSSSIDSSSSSSSTESSSSSSIDSSSSSSSTESSSSSSIDSSSSSSADSSSSSSSFCIECCGCEDVKLALNINTTPTATDISQLDNQYQSTSGGGTGLDGTFSYTSNGGSHYNGGGNEYCLFHPYDALQPSPLFCNSESGIVDNNNCLGLKDNNFDIRLAVYVDSNNAEVRPSSLVSKWDDPNNSGRSWTLDWTNIFAASSANYGLSFLWSDDGTNYSQVDYEFGVSGNVDPTASLNNWYEIRVARSGSTIKVYVDGTALTRTSSDFSGGTEGAYFYDINVPVFFGNNLEVVGGPGNAGWTGYMDYFFIQNGGTVDLSNYTPSKVPFSLPNYI